MLDATISAMIERCPRCGHLQVSPTLSADEHWIMIADYKCPRCSFGWTNYLPESGPPEVG